MSRLSDSGRAEVDGVLARLGSPSVLDLRTRRLQAAETIARSEGVPHRVVGTAEAALLAERVELIRQDLARQLHRAGVALHEPREQMLGLDAAFVDYLLDTFGDAAASSATEWARRAQHAWATYSRSPDAHALATLFQGWVGDERRSVLGVLREVVWAVDVKSDAVGLQAYRDASAEHATGDDAGADVDADAADEVPDELPDRVPAIYSGVLAVLGAAFWAPGRKVVERGGAVLIIDQHGRRAGQWALDSVEESRRLELLADIGAVATLSAHRLLRWLVGRVAERAWQGEAQPQRVVVNRGLQGLAEALAPASGKTSGVLRRTLDVLQHVLVDLPDGGRRALLTWGLSAAARGRPAELVIDVDDALLPAYGATLGKSPRERRAKRLVPMPSALPPLLDHPSTHGPLAALQLLILGELRDCAGQMSREGFGVIPPERWAALMRACGVPLRHQAEVMAAWVAGDDAASSPFLWHATDDPGHAVRLGDRFAAERELLLRSGRRENLGRQRRRGSWTARIR